jgi:hypothetical protein
LICHGGLETPMGTELYSRTNPLARECLAQARVFTAPSPTGPPGQAVRKAG